MLIDNDPRFHDFVSRGLETARYRVCIAENETDGILRLQAGDIDCVLLDTQIHTSSGFEILTRIRDLDHRIPVIFITNRLDTNTAIRASQLGGYDYLVKPFDLNLLIHTVTKAVAARRIMETPAVLTIDDSVPNTPDAFLGRSHAMLEVFKRIGRVATWSVPVLIIGESGTGKELVARAIHQSSPRSRQQFMAVNCAALSDTLLESELFGHERGAFTGADRMRIGKFEACDGGSIFLDEIGDMSLIVQAKVLRLLQKQEFHRIGGNTTISTNVRIIAATNLNLPEKVQNGEFREELLYRLNGLLIRIPPLRDRIEDIPLLLQYFLRTCLLEMRRTGFEGFSADALRILQQYDWPGNVRQLQNTVRHAVMNSVGPIIIPSALPDELACSDPSRHLQDPSKIVPGVLNGNLRNFIDQRIQENSKDLYAESLEQMERMLLAHVLQHTEWNQTHAAEILGITRGKVRDRIRQFGL
ncbi:MAG: sigma-54-dependent Fis family transcriptional regulator [Planctomyces sp.]|nr:sigma-54-dependent Fis family transcriptional regulator [Planctomyces sp.]